MLMFAGFTFDELVVEVPEAFLLELEALALSGQKARALALGRTFLEKYPSSPHAERVRRVIGASAPGTRP
jgi:hypothetical protein